MPLPTGEISFDNIRNEMRNGLGNPGAFAPAPWGSGGMPFNDAPFRSRLTNTAQNAQLSISDIRGNAYQRFTIAADTQFYNIRNALVATGWNGSAKGSADVVINGGVVVSTFSTGTYAMDTGGPWPGPSSIVIYNNGYIVGMGGAGGPGGNDPPSGTRTFGTPGSGGGPGLLIQRATTLVNSGIIGGGGGGGGGSGSFRNLPVRGGGGGGGGGRSGRSNSSGGVGGIGNPRANDGGSGGVGTFSGPTGGGGQGGLIIGPTAAAGRQGGNGGYWGSAGAAGAVQSAPNPIAPGGPGGVAIQGWSAVSGAPSGTIYGPVAG